MLLKGGSARKSSIFIYPLHLGGSNGAAIELNAIFTPPYNAARYGISLVYSPRQADVILISGSVTAKASGPAMELLAELPDDVRLVLLGSEPASGAPFATAYASFGPLLPPATSDERPALHEGLPLPPGKRIAAYVLGSPPDPQVILNAILKVAL